MKFEHPFLATGIGSFPHKEVDPAFVLILNDFQEIPFCPQFPRLSFLEGMAAQYSEGFPCLRWDVKNGKIWVDPVQGAEVEFEKFYESIEKGDVEAFRISAEFSRGVRLLDKLAHLAKKPTYIKGQVVGPVTFGLSVTDHDRKAIFYDPNWRDVVIKHLSMKARWMEKTFKEYLPGVPSIVFFDEPALSSFGSAFSGLHRDEVIHALNECFRAVNGWKGVHCCGNTDWSLLLETDLDILSFDAYGYLETLSLYPTALNAFLERGGVLAWGIVPTSEDIGREDARSLIRRLKAGTTELSRKGIDPQLLNRSILTPSCGTASLSIPSAEQVCHLTADVSRRLREELA